MDLACQNILFFSRTMGLGGTERVVLQLCKILKPYVKKIIVCSSGGINVKELNALNIVHYTIPDIADHNILKVIQILRRLKEIIKEENITIVHTHHRMAAFYVYILGLYKKCVFINTVHNTFFDKKFLTRTVYKHANLIACGDMVKRNLTDYFGIQKERVTVIHNAVEEFNGEIHLVAELHNLKEHGYIIVANVGRLSKQKGMEYFIQSMPLVKQSYKKVKYIIVGDGEDRKKLEDLSVNLGVKDDIIFLGYRADVQNVMIQTDFIVLSSLWEGFPLTPIEAFSVGKTIIATGVDGTIEIVKDKGNGFLVDPGNSERIADKVIELIRNKAIRIKLEKNAKETYLKEFSFKKYEDRILNYYKRILAEGINGDKRKQHSININDN